MKFVGCKLRGKKRRLRAALAVIENGNAELLGLVGEVAGNAGAGEDDDAHRHEFEHAVVALEGCGLAVAGPVGLERDLRDAAVIGPAGGGFLGAFRRAAMEEHHIGMLGEHLVEHGPDALVVGVIDAASEGDLRAFRQQELVFGPAARGDEVPAVDHGGGQVLVIDKASGAGTPG